MPSLPGIVSGEQMLATARAIVRMQEPSGAIPWFPGGHTDPWDHVESAMALSVCGLYDDAQRAYDWLRRTQRDDGSWPLRVDQGVVSEQGVDANFCAYIAVGVWHHYLITADERFVERMWPTVWSAIDVTMRFRGPDGQFYWGADYPVHDQSRMFTEALITGNSSIHQSLYCAVQLASTVGAPEPDWASAMVMVGDLLRERREIFQPPSEHSMDWYYPVLGGAVRGRAGEEMIADRWDEFVVPGKGIHCVDHRPWVTGAETCELALALDVLGNHDAATTLVADIQHLRDPDGAYWTGLVYADGKRWPVEKSSWTSGAVILAVDALSRTTRGNSIFRDAISG